MNKKTKNRTYLIIISIIILIGIIAFNNKPLSLTGTSSDEYIQSPLIGYYECAPARAPTLSPTVSLTFYSDTWDSITCPANSDGCDIFLVGTESSYLSRRFIYKKCTNYNVVGESGCQGQITAPGSNWIIKGDAKVVQIPNLNKDEQILVKFQRCDGVFSFGVCLGYWQTIDGSKTYAQYKPFILWKTTPTSGRNEYNTIEQGCVFQNNKILVDSVSNIKGVTLAQTSTSDVKLEPYKTRNFIETFVPLSPNNVQFVTYNGKSGYCVNRQIFQIATITTNAGTSKIVDTNFNNLLATAPAIECCPGEKEPTRKCNSEYKWVNIVQAECGPYDPCDGIDWEPSGKPRELIKYDCIEGQCVGNTKNVECTSDLDCAGNPNGGICDTKTYTCTSVPVPPVNQTNQTCKLFKPEDCGKGLINICDEKECTACGWYFNYKNTKVASTSTGIIGGCVAGAGIGVWGGFIGALPGCIIGSIIGGVGGDVISPQTDKIFGGTCSLEPPVILQTCKTCDDYALSYIFGGFWKSKQCDAKQGSLVIGFFESIINGLFGKILPENYPQNTTTCAFSFVRFALIPIFSFFIFLFSLDILKEKFKSLKSNKQKTMRVIISLILAILGGFLTYILFWIGLVIIIALIIIKFRWILI